MVNTGILEAKMLRYKDPKNKYGLYFMRYLMYLYNLAITRFEWIDLPEEIPPRFLEDILFWQTAGVFFYDEEAELYGFTAVNLGGNIDNYNVPDTRYAYALHYYRELNKLNSVVLWDSMGQYPMCDLMMMHADALANIRMTRDLNIYANRHPCMVVGPDNYRLSSSNVVKMYNQFVPWIPVKQGFDKEVKFQTLDLKVPIIFPELDIEMKQEIAWALTELGISSSSNFKRERVNTQEATGNMGEMEMARASALAVRERAARQINDMFGLNVSVRFRSDIPIADIVRETQTDQGQDIAEHDMADHSMAE